jgi:CMP/dCMP kinase
VTLSPKKKLIVAIDGPSGAGKSTVGRRLARVLGYTYIDTGAMYRAVALRAGKAGLEADGKALFRLASSLRIEFWTEGEGTRVFCDGEEITEVIRTPEMSLLASDLSRRGEVREAMMELQRKMGRDGGVVLEGRDIGTIVFPRADVKFYLDAAAEVRARRRFEELAAKGVRTDLQEVLEDVVRRDENDSRRALAPLRKADDAILIDSTGIPADQVVDAMARAVRAREDAGETADR